jgi:hypothetical protein
MSNKAKSQNKTKKKSSRIKTPKTKKVNKNKESKKELKAPPPEAKTSRWTMIAIAISMLLSGLLFSAGYLFAKNLQAEKAAAFNADNIGVEVDSALEANFVEQNSFQNFSFDLRLRNNTEYNYQVTVQGEVAEQGSVLSESIPISFDPQDSRLINLEIPLIFQLDSQTTDTSEAQSREVEMILHLRSEISPTGLLEAETKQVDKTIPITLKLAADSELINIAVSAEPDELTYSSDEKPQLTIKSQFNNLLETEQGPGIYELHLLDSEKKRVQPLLANNIILDAGEERIINDQFTFRFPPANQIDPGSQQYYLELVYSGVLGSREYELKTLSEDAITINTL